MGTCDEAHGYSQQLLDTKISDCRHWHARTTTHVRENEICCPTPHPFHIMWPHSLHTHAHKHACTQTHNPAIKSIWSLWLINKVLNLTCTGVHFVATLNIHSHLRMYVYIMTNTEYLEVEATSNQSVTHIHTYVHTTHTRYKGVDPYISCVGVVGLLSFQVFAVKSNQIHQSFLVS